MNDTINREALIAETGAKAAGKAGHTFPTREDGRFHRRAMITATCVYAQVKDTQKGKKARWERTPYRAPLSLAEANALAHACFVRDTDFPMSPTR